MIDSQLSVRDLLHRGLDSFLGDLSPVTDTPVATAGVPAPVPEPEFPMSFPDFLQKFLSPLERKILTAIGPDQTLTQGEIATKVGMEEAQGYASPACREILNQLAARGVLNEVVAGKKKTYQWSAFILEEVKNYPAILHPKG